MHKLVLFGDSITAGYYENEITDLLTTRVQQGVPQYEVINAGIPGDTTIDGLARIEPFVLRHQPDYVTVFFGANDAAIHRLMSVEQYKEKLQEIIYLIGPEKVLLLSAPYTSQRNRKLDRPLGRMVKFVAAAEEVALTLKLPFINVLDEMVKTGREEAFLQEDGLHFSLEGYDFLAELIVSGLHKKIEEKE